MWGICLMHLPPLPFEKLFEYIDGSVTKNRETWTGPIGKKFNMALEDYPPLANFTPIPGKVPFLTEIEDLNKDLQLLLQFSWAVQNGPK